MVNKLQPPTITSRQGRNIGSTPDGENPQKNITFYGDIPANSGTYIIKPQVMLTEREDLFISIYRKAFPLVAKYIAKQGGSFEEAKDIFQDALMIWYEKKPTLIYSESSYIFGIAKHLWSKRNHHTQPLADDDGIAMEEPLHPADKKLMTLLQTAGQKCMELLRAFYYDKLPLNKVAGQFGFSGVRSATVQKYKCLEKIRDTVKEKSLQYEDFFE